MVLLLLTLFTIVYERKVVARMAVRPGPNQVGPKGWLQSLTDGIKLPFKEEIIPKTADKVVYFIAPVISATWPSPRSRSSRSAGRVDLRPQTALQLTDVPVSVLVLLACSSMSVYGVVLAGWASGSTYPLLGGLRSSAQMISYEVAMGLSIVAVFMTAGTMSHLADRRGAGRQRPSRRHLGWHPTAPSWYAVLLLPSFVIYCISAVGETNRAPFDLPEAESELVGGFHTEYSSFKFALFFLAEYINMITVSAFATTLFLGGWRAPWPITAFWDGANAGWWPLIWFRQGADPAVRLHLAAGHPAPDALRPVHALRLEGAHPGQPGLDPLPGRRQGRQERALRRREGGWSWRHRGRGLAGRAVLAASKKERELSIEEQLAARPPGSFPVPPMDLQVPPSPRARRAVAEREPATVGGTTRPPTRGEKEV